MRDKKNLDIVNREEFLLGIKESQETFKSHGYLKYTDLLEIEDEEGSNQIFFKNEAVDFTENEEGNKFLIPGSFKWRGALNIIDKFVKPDTKIITASSAGNHSQGVASAVKILNRERSEDNKLKAVIFMPRNAPMMKVAGTIKHGGAAFDEAKYLHSLAIGGDFAVKSGDIEIRLIAGDFDDANLSCKKYTEEHNALYIHPFDHKTVICGQATVAMEIREQLQEKNIDLDKVTILSPTGGGGLTSGVALVFADTKAKIIGVESEEAATYSNAFSLENPQAVLSTVNTIADGTAVRQPGFLTYKILKSLNVEIATVKEEAIKQAISDVYHGKIKGYKGEIEGASALVVAKYKELKKQENGRVYVVIISGKNIAKSRLEEVLSLK